MAGYIGSKAVSVNTTSATISDDLTVGDDATITGDLDVDGTTNLDVIDVDGAANFAADVTFAAGADIITATAGDNNTRVGVNAGISIADGGNYNTVMGDSAGTAISTGDLNTFIGYQSGDATTLSGNNVGVGYASLGTNILSSKNVAIGNNALKLHNLASAGEGFDVAVGHTAGEELTTGINNTFVGAGAGLSLTVGEQNVAIGKDALSTDDVGAHCVAVGADALANQNATGTTSNNFQNTAVGYSAGNDIIGGYYNTCIGALAGDEITTGLKNICIGRNADIQAVGQNNGIILGTDISGAGNDFTFGMASNIVVCDFDADATFERSSDLRLKTDVADVILGLDFINDLRPVTYKWKASGDLDANDPELAHLRTEDEDGNIINQMTTDVTMHGLIAQEVKTALDTANVSNFKGWDKDNFGVQTVSREMYVIPLIKAVQELSTALDAALARITELEG